MDSASLLAELDARMPELEWQLSKPGVCLNSRRLPKGLFRVAAEAGVREYVAEIKNDINRLAIQKNQRAALHLAQTVKQKIAVLVMLCHEKKSDKKPQEQKVFNLETLSTRQQWMQSLEMTIETLSLQKDALLRVLSQADNNKLLALQAEIGEVERQLTLAREACEKL